MLEENLIKIYETSFRENREMPALTDYFKGETFSYYEMAKEIAKLHLFFKKAEIRRGDKIAFISDNELAMTTLFQILMGEMKPDEGSFKWGVTTSQSYFPKDNNEFFEGHEENMLDWIAPYSQTDTLESTLRGFLGRMLFSGDDVYKPVRVLSGGEKVRLMLARMMLFGSNVLVVDQPTNHLDLESITAVNNGVRDFKGTVLFASHDHEFVQTIATRIIEIREKGVLDKECTYDEFLDFRETYKG